MNERICEKCENIDYGKWGILGLIGYSLVMCSLGFALGRILLRLSFLWAWIIMLIGMIFWAPLAVIAYKAERAMRKKEIETE